MCKRNVHHLGGLKLVGKEKQANLDFHAPWNEGKDPKFSELTVLFICPRIFQWFAATVKSVFHEEITYLLAISNKFTGEVEYAPSGCDRDLRLLAKSQFMVSLTRAFHSCINL